MMQTSEATHKKDEVQDTSSDEDKMEDDYKNSHLVKCRYYRNRVP